MNFKEILEKNRIMASVPCRVDLGGTLDISTLYLPLHHLSPSSFNIALDLRTTVTLFPWDKGYVKVSSRGFDSAVFKNGEARFNHPMGLVFAIANYFNAHGVHIVIESASPPRSALGGSSSAAVAIISAFFKALDRPIHPEQVAWLAHFIESSVAGVPCGMQDQLAAAFGGVNQWVWKMGDRYPEFKRIPVFENETDVIGFNDNILVAYCGIPHVSKDINKRWIESFVRGETTAVFKKIIDISAAFSNAVKDKNFSQAAAFMNQETRLRLEMTPDVLDNAGQKMFEKAVTCNCGARFTGAGGGGCLWAVGKKRDIAGLKSFWQHILSPIESAAILDTKIDNSGIITG